MDDREPVMLALNAATARAEGMVARIVLLEAVLDLYHEVHDEMAAEGCDCRACKAEALCGRLGVGA